MVSRCSVIGCEQGSSRMYGQFLHDVKKREYTQTSHKQTLLYYDNVYEQNVFYEIKCTVVVQEDNEISFENNQFPVKSGNFRISNHGRRLFFFSKFESLKITNQKPIYLFLQVYPKVFLRQHHFVVLEVSLTL